MAGLIAGAAAGAALALLFTPLSGREMQEALRRHFRNASADAREAGLRAEADILTRYQQVTSASMSSRPGPENLQPRVA
jgi:gas vesicle protein